MGKLHNLSISKALAPLSGFALAINAAASTPLPSYRTGLPPGELREELSGYVANLRSRAAASTPVSHDDLDALMRLVGSYRAPGAGGNLPLGSSIVEGPYLGLIVGQVLRAYPQIYSEALKGLGVSDGAKTPYSKLFDAAIHLYVHGSPDGKPVPDVVKQAGDQIGDCLAKRIDREVEKIQTTASSPHPEVCPLDDSLKTNPPNLVKLGAIKFLGCPLDLVPNDCELRQMVYDEAKPQLIQLGSTIRDQFVKKLNDTYVSMGQILAQKFGGQMNPLLEHGAPLVERDGQSMTQANYTLHDFAAGLLADVSAAEILHDSSDPLERGVSAALTYAAANRLLLFTGGAVNSNPQLDTSKAKADESGFILDQSDAGKRANQYDPLHPDRPPVFAGESFGGWGVGLDSSGNAVFSPWDWGNYSSASGGSLRIFPSLFQIDSSGRPSLLAGVMPSENLADLAELLNAVTEFLKATAPNGPLGEHFVDTSSLASALTDAGRPGIFPMDGRALGFGVAAGILQNIAAPKVGHIERNVLLTFHDAIALTPRDNQPASTHGVGEILLAAGRFSSLMSDPQMPAKVVPYLKDIDSAVWAGTLMFTGIVQCLDGGFPTQFVDCSTVSAGPGSIGMLAPTIDAMRAITAGYGASREPVVAARLEQGWKYMGSFWGTTGFVPRESAADPLGQGQPVNPSRLWEVLNLWQETQAAGVPTDLPSIDWAIWKTRFDALRSALNGQLKTQEGPKPLAPS